MFFSITTESRTNFACHHKLGRISVFTDAGWRATTNRDRTAIYKGYADDFDLSQNIDSVVSQSEPRFTGNFCVIFHDHRSGQIEIHTDVWRSFPIFLHQDEVTNLVGSETVAWTDSVVSVDQDFVISERKFDVIGDISVETLSLTEALDQINDVLRDKTKKFLSHNKLPIKIHLSGGVDSLLVASLLHIQEHNHEIVRARHFDYDRFWLANDTQIREQFWAYNQLHHWLEPCVLISGAPGDEFMLRSPVTIDQLLKYRGQSTIDLLRSRRDTLHYDYFLKPKHMQIFENQSVDFDLCTRDFYWHLCNIVLNDWQHWHLGHTLTWTPLRDLRIFKIMLRLDHAQALDQIFDSGLSKMLIEKNSPGMSSLISDQKNSHNPMKNLSDWLFQDTQ